MSYLINATNTYRVATVQDALNLRELLSKQPNGDLISFSYTTKFIKEKGEIVEEYQLCKAKFSFTEEKEPEQMFYAEYNTGSLEDED